MIASLNPSLMTHKNPNFPFAPEDWSESEADRSAHDTGIELGPDHRALLSALQEYFSKHDQPDVHMRALHDALEEKFHAKGGLKYLYGLFPGGPVAQGCRLAGLPVPPSALNRSFGSVQ